MTRALALVAGVLVWLAGCAPSEAKKTPESQPPAKVSPLLRLTPPPGSYAAYFLDVTVATEPGYDIYFAIGAEPDVSRAQAYRDSFDVRLIRGSRLYVTLRSPAGELFGPYIFEYNLIALANEGTCHITPPKRKYFRADETIPISLQYLLPAALARLELAVNGVWRDLVVTTHLGGLDMALGPFAEGPIDLHCRVVQGQQSWQDDLAVNVFVDGTPPIGRWLTDNFVFTQQNWRNVLSLEATDALSGLAGVNLCNRSAGACMPLAHQGSGLYQYATALTDGTGLTAEIEVVLEDRAGNSYTLPPAMLDFSGFRDPVPVPAPLPITLTTAATLDLVTATGHAPAQVRRLDDAASPLGEPATALTLTSGWNDFLYRLAESAHWRSYGIYRAGVEVFLPPASGHWLVYSSAATLPALHVQREAVLPPNAGEVVWPGPWPIETPHLFFVDDRDGDDRWSEPDRVYVDHGDRWQGSPWRSIGEPVRIEAASLVEYLPEIPALTRELTLFADGGLPPGDLYFQWRSSLGVFPAIHRRLPSGGFPRPVSVPAGGVCLFFLDVSGHGAPSADAPRAWGPCTEASMRISTRPGPLALVELPNYALPFLNGIPYGGEVTGIITVESQFGEPLFTYPGQPVGDAGGLGHALLSSGFDLRYPALPATFQFFDGEGSATWHPDVVPAAAPDSTLDVLVTDEAGSLLPAVVLTGKGGQTRYATFSGGGFSAVPVTGEAPYRLYAVRDGFLSEKALTPDSQVTLRALSPAVTGVFHGRISDGVNALGNAEIIWENALYRAAGRSAPDGTYALPASGGDGLLTIVLHEVEGTRTVQYPNFITQESKSADFLIAPRPRMRWPLGLHHGDVPNNITGPGAVQLEVGDSYYHARITGSTEGVWAAHWPGFLRAFDLPGALPAFPITTWTPYAVPGSRLALHWVDSFARCGDWEQRSPNTFLVQGPCWTWLAQDGLQTYALGRLLNDAFPEEVGLGVLEISVTTAAGTLPAGKETLMLHDQILPGRTIRVALSNGMASVAVPAGVYAVTASDGRRLQHDAMPAVISIVADGISGYALHLP